MLLQKVCAVPKTKFNEQKSSFGIAQKVFSTQITILQKNTNINIPTSANKLFIVLCFMNLFLNITANNYKIYMLLNINVRISKLCSQDEFTFKYNCNCKYCSTKSSLLNLHDNVVTSLWILCLPELVMIYILCLPEQVMIYISAYLNKS